MLRKYAPIRRPLLANSTPSGRFNPLAWSKYIPGGATAP